VLALGNALVDILCSVDDSFLSKHNFAKGTMTLISNHQAQNLYNDMGQTHQVSGGSAANSVAVLSNLGGKTAFIGSIADDAVGKVFAHDIQAVGVDFYGFLHENSPEETGRCNILVTADAQRTMCTYLGVAGNIPLAALDESLIDKSSVTYIEGYLWDQPQTKESIKKAITHAKSGGRITALTFSDVFCVERHRSEFKELLENNIHIVFANENEITSFFETDNFDDAVRAAQKMNNLFALTRGEQGAVIVCGDDVFVIDAVKPVALVDTTGAGDAFAAGFLYGLTHGKSYTNSAKIGCICASQIISHFGARPQISLKSLIQDI
jgi:sugar/nucleoside kinase (ribokinase family)